jgi:Cu(I)/Ag(I) efflux system membrane protein CusA/SilA
MPNARAVPLDEVAEVKRTRGGASIPTEDGHLIVYVFVDIRDRDRDRLFQ